MSLLKLPAAFILKNVSSFLERLKLCAMTSKTASSFGQGGGGDWGVCRECDFVSLDQNGLNSTPCRPGMVSLAMPLFQQFLLFSSKLGAVTRVSLCRRQLHFGRHQG